jgi:trans-aconitate 2-methyltransferase
MIKYLCKTLFFVNFLFLCSEIVAEQWNGDDYARNSSVQFTHAERLLRNVILYGNEKILDIGCGDGKITAFLATSVPNGYVIGIDPSVAMLASAEKNSRINLKFFKGSAEDFSFSEQFDHIFAIHVMHWIKEQERALKNIYSHLKPNGQAHFILAPSKEGLPFFRALQKTVEHWLEDFEGFVNPQQVFDMESYRKLLVDVGFHIEGIHYVYHKSIHENKEKLKLWIKQWLPHGKYLSNEKQDLFLDELIGNYLMEIGLSPDTVNSVEWGEYVLFVEASKP